MRNTLIAASLIAGIGGFVATSAAYADAFNGEAQHAIEYSHNSANAAPDFDMVAAAPNAYAMPAPGAPGVNTNSDISTKSHGRP